MRPFVCAGKKTQADAEDKMDGVGPAELSNLRMSVQRFIRERRTISATGLNIAGQGSLLSGHQAQNSADEILTDN